MMNHKFQLLESVLFPLRDTWENVPVTEWVSQEDMVKALLYVADVFDGSKNLESQYLVTSDNPEWGDWHISDWLDEFGPKDT